MMQDGHENEATSEENYAHLQEGHRSRTEQW
jgi:hypothetical protein